MLTCRRTLQIQLQLNPRQGSVNDCDLAVLTFTAHAELEATCASGISETKHSTRGLVDQSVSPCSHSELPWPKLTASGHQSGKFRAGQRLRLLSLSHPVAGVVASVLGVHIDGLAGIGNSRTSLLSLLQRILFDVGCASVGLRLGWISG